MKFLALSHEYVDICPDIGLGWGVCVGATNRRFKPRFDSRRRSQACWRARSGIALQQNGGVWLGWSGKIAPGDELETRVLRHKNIEYVVIDQSKDDFEENYSGFANRVLWPILHYRLDLAEFARRDLSGYSRVNEHFATKLEKIIENDDLIWVRDYHLIPIADALRRRVTATGSGFSCMFRFPRRRF